MQEEGVEEIHSPTQETCADQKRIEELKQAIDEKSKCGMTIEQAKNLTSNHIAALDKYNTCKDHTQKIIQTIALIEGKTLNEVLNQFGLSATD